MVRWVYVISALRCIGLVFGVALRVMERGWYDMSGLKKGAVAIGCFPDCGQGRVYCSRPENHVIRSCVRRGWDESRILDTISKAVMQPARRL
jgi:hypothetical protein